MAEILGPLGFCTGSLGFILSTIPALAKTHQTYLECSDQLREYKLRVESCDARVHALKLFWGSSKESQCANGQAGVAEIRDDIERLRSKILEELKDYDVAERGVKSWWELKLDFRRKSAQQPRGQLSDFRHSKLYALFKRNEFESWLPRLEKAVECLERYSSIDLKKKTAGQVKDHDPDQGLKLRNVRNFFGDLMMQARSLYDGTIGSSATGMAYDWALGLRAPNKGEDVANWEFIADVNIELSFSMSRHSESENLQLQFRHHTADLSTRIHRNQIEQLIKKQVGSGKGRSFTLPSVELRSARGPQTRRTRSLGNVFEEKPGIFKGAIWRLDRSDLIYGMLNWTLLLWDTKWLGHLCCYGFQFDKDLPGIGCTQMLALKNCPEGNCRDQSTRLEALGIVLAELLLATPIRLGCSLAERSMPPYQRFIEGQWKSCYMKDIVHDVRVKTFSTELARVVLFCFEDESELATEEFQPEFVLRCLDKIYNPVFKWYEDESKWCAEFAKTFARKIADDKKHEYWPEAAMYQRADSITSELQLHVAVLDLVNN